VLGGGVEAEVLRSWRLREGGESIYKKDGGGGVEVKAARSASVKADEVGFSLVRRDYPLHDDKMF
jgi:hypothetical protein